MLNMDINKEESNIQISTVNKWCFIYVVDTKWFYMWYINGSICGK